MSLDKTPLTRYQFTSILNNVCQNKANQPKSLTQNSFRIGRATNLDKEGVSSENIKKLGRWSSNTFSKYTHTCEI